MSARHPASWVHRRHALGVMAAAAFTACATESPPQIDAARVAALSWLSLIDAGQYAASWTSSAPMFQRAVTAADWQRAASAVRTPLGAIKSRAVRSAQFTRQLPGAADGQYVIFQFDAAFANKAGSIETLTMALDADAWRAVGYFIR